MEEVIIVSMPSIKRTERGGVIRWDGDDWLKGLSPYFTTTLNLMGGTGLLYNTGINPFSRPGMLLQGPAPANVTNASVIDAVLKNGVGNGVDAYVIGGTKLHKILSSDGTVTNAGAWPHTITAAAPNHAGHLSVSGQDTVIYYVGTTKYLFYSWVDNTDGDIGRYDLSATFDDDFMTTVPSGASATGFTNTTLKSIPMIVGDDNILYAGNGRYVAAYNGNLATPTINYQALDLPSDYIITSFAKLKNFLVIYAYKGATNSGGNIYKTETTAFFWDYVSDSFTYAYPLSGNYVNGGFSFNNTVGCFVYGENYGLGVSPSKNSKLLLFDGEIFKTLVNFSESIPGHGGVETFDNVIQWNAQGKIYQYGSPITGVGEGAVNIISSVNGGSTVEGMLRAFSANFPFASAGTGTSGGLQSFNGGTYANAYFLTHITAPPFPEFSQGRIKAVKIFWFGLANSGHGFTLNINTNYGSTTSSVINNSVSITNNITLHTYDVSGNPFPKFEMLQLEGSYTASTVLSIRAVEVYFEDVNINQ